MPVQYKYTAPFGSVYPNAYAVITRASWQLGSPAQIHVDVWVDKQTHDSGAQPVYSFDVSEQVDVSGLTGLVDAAIAARPEITGTVVA